MHYYSLIKRAAALANKELGVVDAARAYGIIEACDEIAMGQHSDQFPVALVLGGGGTTANMNVNEVIASRATQIASIAVHPNDHVNASQSSNDTFVCAMALTVLDNAGASVAGLRRLTESLSKKAAEYDGTQYLGRTCLNDAVTVEAGRTLRSQANAVQRNTASLQASFTPLAGLPLGATVLGTGIGAPSGFGQTTFEHLRTTVDLPITIAVDPLDSLAHADPYAELADSAARAAITIAKIAADLRLRASGPNGGFAEVTLPGLQPGSSIMPGKVNPVVPEFVMQLSYRIRGRAQTVSYAVASGELELNVMSPVILDSLIDILSDLKTASTTLAAKCIDGLTWDGPRRIENVSHALDRWIDMARKEGYDVAAGDARKAAESRESDVR